MVLAPHPCAPGTTSTLVPPRPGKRASEDARISPDIARIDASSRDADGGPRIAALLPLEGRHHGRSCIARPMRGNSLCGRQKGRYRIEATDGHRHGPRRCELPPKLRN